MLLSPTRSVSALAQQCPKHCAGALRFNASFNRRDSGQSGSKPGSEIVLKYVEVMEHGELGMRPLHALKVTDRIRLGGSIKRYRSKFTTHGFRSFEVEGWDCIALDDVVGLAISSLPGRLGHFECSHALLNRLHLNVVSSTLANTISLPTDCPLHDERLGDGRHSGVCTNPQLCLRRDCLSLRLAEGSLRGPKVSRRHRAHHCAHSRH